MKCSITIQKGTEYDSEKANIYNYFRSHGIDVDKHLEEPKGISLLPIYYITECSNLGLSRYKLSRC